jgi:UDP-glucose 4-epimerase
MGRPRYLLKFFTSIGRFFGISDAFMRSLMGLSRVPVLDRLVEPIFGLENLNVRYLPLNMNIPEPENVLLPYVVLEKFIRAASCLRILNVCLCRESFDCRHYPKDFGCLFIGSGAEEIDDSVGRKVGPEEALLYVKKAFNLGLMPVAGKVSADALILGVRNHHHLMTICFCCECCCVGRYVPQLSRQGKAGVKRLDGLDVVVTDACRACCECQSSCTQRSLVLVGDRMTIEESCLGCGRCVSRCPNGAIELRYETSRLVTEAVAALQSAVDVRGR